MLRFSAHMKLLHTLRARARVRSGLRRPPEGCGGTGRAEDPVSTKIKPCFGAARLGMSNESRDVLLLLPFSSAWRLSAVSEQKCKGGVARERLAFELRQRRHVLSASAPDVLHSQLMLTHRREKDGCSQISPLKKYIKRANRGAEPRTTRVTSRGTEQYLGMRGLRVGASAYERRCRKGLPSLSRRRLYFWLYASPRVQNSVCGDCVGLDGFVWKGDRKSQ